jgi:hypothetical protein
MARETIIELKPILPQKGNFAVFELAIRSMIDDELEEIEKALNRYTNTWQHKPKWSKQTKKRRSEFVGRIGTTTKRFVWVEEGTKSYYASMTKGFIPKTKPGRIISGAGSGGFKGLNSRPKRPGIKARKNLPVIAKTREIPFAVDATKKMDAAAKALFSGSGSITFRSI